MRSMAWMKKGLAVLATATLVFGVYLTVERPWFQRWGATDRDVSRELPGDGRAWQRNTRAVTIHAAPDQVWPWVAQIGQDRAGFYSYEILEDLVGCRMPGATTLLPGRQSWKPGDKLWMYPPEKAGGAGGAPLFSYAEGERLVFATRRFETPPSEPTNGTWGFYLETGGHGATRLLARGTATAPVGPLATVFDRLLFEPAHYVMERRMLLNIKTLAEGRQPSKLEENAAVALWTVTVFLMLAALFEVTRRKQWTRPLFVAGAAALVFQLLTLLQPPAIVGATAVIALALGLWWRTGRRAPMLTARAA